MKRLFLFVIGIFAFNCNGTEVCTDLKKQARELVKHALKIGESSDKSEIGALKAILKTLSERFNSLKEEAKYSKEHPETRQLESPAGTLRSKTLEDLIYFETFSKFAGKALTRYNFFGFDTAIFPERLLVTNQNFLIKLKDFLSAVYAMPQNVDKYKIDSALDEIINNINSILTFIGLLDKALEKKEDVEGTSTNLARLKQVCQHLRSA